MIFSILGFHWSLLSPEDKKFLKKKYLIGVTISLSATKKMCVFLFREKNIFKKFSINPRMKFWKYCSIYVLRLINFHSCNFLHNVRFCASIHKFCNLLHNLRSCAPILYILQFRCRIFKILQNCLPRGAILQYSLYWKLSARCRIHGSPVK